MGGRGSQNSRCTCLRAPPHVKRRGGPLRQAERPRSAQTPFGRAALCARCGRRGEAREGNLLRLALGAGAAGQAEACPALSTHGQAAELR